MACTHETDENIVPQKVLIFANKNKANYSTVICINFVRQFFVRNFRVTILSFISNVHHIFTVYDITSKQFLCKKFSSFCTKRKFFNNENFANYSMYPTEYLVLYNTVNLESLY